ncbi:MAG: MoxR family ATPase [Candidatus Gracilibacteria bacterium]|nr:MoxR family ATPase [Candidatus Gracilibacteria bacterium]
MSENINLENLTSEKIENKIEADIAFASTKIQEVKTELKKKIVGQENLIDCLLIGLFANGHILVEGVPGLAKTLTVDSLSKALDLGFNRVQFTPDLLPSDLIGTEIYNSKTSNFEIKKGPIFNNFILADEINRAPSKVQSALLEAMAEKHITIGNHTFDLDRPFLVLATQNPIEQTGTYKLPEAQLDRFMLKVNVDYPSYEDEKSMYKKNIDGKEETINKVLSKKDISKIQDTIKEIFVSDSIFEYTMNIVDATRNPDNYKLSEIKKYISYGVSPRAGLAIISASKVVALMANRSYVIPEDVKKIASDVLSHRLVLTYEAMADEINSSEIIKKIVDNINVV